MFTIPTDSVAFCFDIEFLFLILKFTTLYLSFIQLQTRFRKTVPNIITLHLIFENDVFSNTFVVDTIVIA